MFSRNFRLSAGPSVDHEISTSVDKLMPRRMIPPQKSGLKSGSLSTASSAHGVPRGRRLWPGNSVPRRMGNVTRGRRARGPSPGLGSQPASLFCSGRRWRMSPWAHMGQDRSRGVISPPCRREPVLQTNRNVLPRRDVSPRNKITSPKKMSRRRKKELYQRKTLPSVEKRQAFSRQGKKNFSPWKGVRGIIYHGQAFIMSWKGSWKDPY